MRDHQDDSKCPYVTRPPRHAGVSVAQSRLSSVSPCWPFHKVPASTRGVRSQQQPLALSPACFLIETIRFLICFPVVLSPYYLIPRSLKARWYRTTSTLFEGFRPLLGLVYVAISQIPRKIEDIVQADAEL